MFISFLWDVIKPTHYGGWSSRCCGCPVLSSRSGRLGSDVSKKAYGVGGHPSRNSHKSKTGLCRVLEHVDVDVRMGLMMFRHFNCSESLRRVHKPAGDWRIIWTKWRRERKHKWTQFNLVILGLFRSSPVHSEGSGNMGLIYILRQSLSLLKFAGCNGWDFADTSGQTTEPVRLLFISVLEIKKKIQVVPISKTGQPKPWIWLSWWIVGCPVEKPTHFKCTTLVRTANSPRLLYSSVWWRGDFLVASW